MRLPATGHKAAALWLLLASTAANAAVLTLPAPNSHERPPAGNVHTLDLQSACASEARCQLQSGLETDSLPGQGADQAIAPAPVIDMSQFTSSFTAGSTGDGALLSLVGNPLQAYPTIPASGGAATGGAADDEAFAWKFSQGLAQAVTNMRALVALPEDRQGNALFADAAMTGTCQDAGMAGTHPECAAGSFVPVVRSLCVAGDGSYNTVGATGQRDCPKGSIYVSNKRGAGTAEYAAYAQSLNGFAKDAVSFYRLQSAETRFPRHESAARQAWSCRECNDGQAGEAEPSLRQRVLAWLKDPSVMLLLGLVLVGAVVADAVIKSRRA